MRAILSLAVLSGEDPGAFAEHFTGYAGRFKPVDYFEFALVEDIAIAALHGQRARAVLNRLLDNVVKYQRAPQPIEAVSDGLSHFSTAAAINAVSAYLARCERSSSAQSPPSPGCEKMTKRNWMGGAAARPR